MSTDDVVANALALGVKHFQGQNYHKLLKVFSKAIDLANSYDNLELLKKYGKLIHPKLPLLLDSRALTYEKLGDLKRAGKDGEDLIELDVLNCKGYLRVSKILLILDKKMEAYRVLTKGFRKISVAIEENQLKKSAYFEQLVRQRKTLIKSIKEDQEANVKARHVELPNHDPFMKLPIEITKHILSHIPFKHLRRLMLVSRYWHELVSSIPELWDTIDLTRTITSVAFKNLYTKIIAANKRRYKAKLDHLQIQPRRTDERLIMNLILNFVKLQIQSLRIKLYDFDLRDLLIKLTSSKLARYNFSNLTKLKIECDIYTKFENFILEMLPQLKDLEIVITNIKKPQNLLEIENDSDVLQKLSSQYDLSDRQFPLTNLSIIYTQRPPSVVIPFHDLLQNKKFPNLTKLAIVGFQIQDLSIFQQPLLKEVILEQNLELSLPNFLNATTSQNWETLYLRESKLLVTQRSIVTELLHLSQLKFLDLTGCALNFDTLISILKLTDENLEILNIGACPNLIWQSSGFDRSTTRNPLVNFETLINYCPNLIKLSLNQSTNLNDFTLKSMGNTLLSNFQFYKLQILDLSFNNITGQGLVEFFHVQNKSNIRIKINKLIVDGNDIKNETLDYLKKMKVVDDVQYEFNRKLWKQYGVNSYSPV